MQADTLQPARSQQTHCLVSSGHLDVGIDQVSGRLANPTQNTGYEPNLYRSINEEHTPINPPDSFQCRDDATIISAAEDPEVPNSGASSNSERTAASRVPTMSGFSGVGVWKQWPESVDSRASIQATGVNVDGESVVATIFSSQSKGKRDRDQNVVHSSRQKISRKSLNGKLTQPSEEREWLSKNCVKLRLQSRQEI